MLQSLHRCAHIVDAEVVEKNNNPRLISSTQISVVVLDESSTLIEAATNAIAPNLNENVMIEIDPDLTASIANIDNYPPNEASSIRAANTARARPPTVKKRNIRRPTGRLVDHPPTPDPEDTNVDSITSVLTRSISPPRTRSRMRSTTSRR